MHAWGSNHDITPRGAQGSQRRRLVRACVSNTSNTLATHFTPLRTGLAEPRLVGACLSLSPSLSLCLCTYTYINTYKPSGSYHYIYL